jgi:cysteine desulfurase
MKVYLDNAATTRADERVFEAMKPFLTENYGNPSSIHSHGRAIRSAIEQARRKVAELMHAAPAEIFFTSGGTEADNTIIRNAIGAYNIKVAITSSIEHHAVLHTLEHMEKSGIIQLCLLDLDEQGAVDYEHLEKLLSKNKSAFVSLMHANNEIGNITSLDRVAELCKAHGAFFHSDTVQSIGHVDLDLNAMKIDSIVGSAHKFHGPKGVGMMYMNADRSIPPLLIGGGQERNMRGGTENVAGIIGLAKALELAYEEKQNNPGGLLDLKKYTLQQLEERFPKISFNGQSADFENSLDKILSLSIPGIEDNDMLLFNLDINGISVSGGSACASGTSIGSHVLDALEIAPNSGTLRISFSKFNTTEDIDYLIERLGETIKS